MPWDRGYYYRAQRIGGKPTRVFVGGGLLGALAAQTDADERAQRAAAADAGSAAAPRTIATQSGGTPGGGGSGSGVAGL